MEDMNVEDRPDGDVGAPTYEAPAVETRSSLRDPLVWVVAASPVICL